MCGSHDPLQASHIVPEFAYKPIYDAKHKGYIVNPLAPHESRKFQKGLREQMLCRACEQFLNDEYEKHFKYLWFDRRILSPLEKSCHAILDCGDYRRFKLFHLSVLLRAEFSTLPGFSEVRLEQEHRARITQLVRSGDPGEPHEFPIVCMAVERPGDGGVWWDFIASPNPGWVYGLHFYLITFGGCGWMYFVGSHRDSEVEQLALRSNGTLPVAKLPWAAFKRYAPHAKIRRA